MNTTATYRWDDGRGNFDTQTAATFMTPTPSGWRADYDATRDEWIAWGPYGTTRRYQRVTR